MQASGIASHFLFRMAQSLFVITVPCVLPDRDPVFRRQIHSVAFLYIIGFHKFIELLDDHIGPQVAQRMVVVPQYKQISLVTGIAGVRLSVASEELVVVIASNFALSSGVHQSFILPSLSNWEPFSSKQ